MLALLGCVALVACGDGGGSRVVDDVAPDGMFAVGTRELAATIAFFDHYLKRERGSRDRLLAVDDLDAARLDSQLE